MTKTVLETYFEVIMLAKFITYNTHWKKTPINHKKIIQVLNTKIKSIICLENIDTKQ